MDCEFSGCSIFGFLETTVALTSLSLIGIITFSSRFIITFFDHELLAFVCQVKYFFTGIIYSQKKPPKHKSLVVIVLSNELVLRRKGDQRIDLFLDKINFAILFSNLRFQVTKFPARHFFACKYSGI
jgi:hypothetical protein